MAIYALQQVCTGRQHGGHGVRVLQQGGAASEGEGVGVWASRAAEPPSNWGQGPPSSRPPALANQPCLPPLPLFISNRLGPLVVPPANNLPPPTHTHTLKPHPLSWFPCCAAGGEDRGA